MTETDPETTDPGTTDPETTDPETTDPETVVRSYLASFRRRDVDRIAAHVSEDFVNCQTAALGTSCNGRSAYREKLRVFVDSIHDLSYEPERILVADDGHVAAFYTLIGLWARTRPLTVRGVQHLFVVDGLIHSRTDYWDSAVFVSQAYPDSVPALEALGLIVE